MILAVVVDPSSQDGVVLCGKFLEGVPCRSMNAPFPHRLTHGLGCVVTSPGTECDKESSILTLCRSGPEGVPQEVKLLIGVCSLSAATLTVDDFGLG